MKLEELETKLTELKTVKESERTEAQTEEIQTLEKDIGIETQAKTRFDELSTKDENELTAPELDELIQLEEKFPAEPAPAKTADTKYAGKYESIEDLLKGIQSSEQEKERVLKDHPELVGELENIYKGSQRSVTKLVRKSKEPPVRHPSSVPLEQKELHEMTQPEYDTWEKKDKFAAHTWLSNATRKESSRVDSRKKVFSKYPQFYAMSQGVVQGDDKWTVFDRLATEHPEWMGEVNGAELAMDAMEKELKIAPVVKKKPVILKPGFEQGKGGKGKAGASTTLTADEYAALSDDERDAYAEGSYEKKNK